MKIMQLAILVLVGVTGTALVLTRNPESQVIGLSYYGLVLALMFFIFQAPDVAFSQIVVGAVALPLMFMLALTKIRRQETRSRHAEEEQASEPSPPGKGKEGEAA